MSLRKLFWTVFVVVEKPTFLYCKGQKYFQVQLDEMQDLRNGNSGRCQCQLLLSIIMILILNIWEYFYDGGDGDYDDDDIFHATQTKTQFVDSVLFDKNC